MAWPHCSSFSFTLWPMSKEALVMVSMSWTCFFKSNSIGLSFLIFPKFLTIISLFLAHIIDLAPDSVGLSCKWSQMKCPPRTHPAQTYSPFHPITAHGFEKKDILSLNFFLPALTAILGRNKRAMSIVYSIPFLLGMAPKIVLPWQLLSGRKGERTLGVSAI